MRWWSRRRAPPVPGNSGRWSTRWWNLLARCRVIRRGLSPDKFCVSYGGTGGELILTLSDFVAA